MTHGKCLSVLEQGGIEYIADQRLADKTWIHRGPVVPFYALPADIGELEYLIRELTGCGAAFKVVGHTSNIYFQESYRTDVVISTLHLNGYTIEEDCIVCETGASVERLSRECVAAGIPGFEGLVDLPGTVGAAIVNNSGCFSCCLSDLMEEAEALVIEDGRVSRKTLRREDFGFVHRSSAIKRHELDGIILRVKLRKQPCTDAESLKKVAGQNMARRKATQEGRAHYLGSVFSGLKVKKVGIFSFGWAKAPEVLAYKVMDRLFRKKLFFRRMKVRWTLDLFGYPDLVGYVSPKGLNCFLWRDEGADEAFVRYCEFMHRYAVCKELEIEVLS